MSTPKKENTNMEEVQAALQALIAQGKKEGMIRLSDLNAQLEKLQPVSYTHLDVYKRQVLGLMASSAASSRTLGSLSPDCNTPVEICSLKPSMIWV